MKLNITYDITLSDYVAKHGTDKAAAAIGVQPGAVWFMLKAKREIYLRKKKGKKGAMEMLEIKPWAQGGTRAKKA